MRACPDDVQGSALHAWQAVSRVAMLVICFCALVRLAHAIIIVCTAYRGTRGNRRLHIVVPLQLCSIAVALLAASSSVVGFFWFTIDVENWSYYFFFAAQFGMVLLYDAWLLLRDRAMQCAVFQTSQTGLRVVHVLIAIAMALIAMMAILPAIGVIEPEPYQTLHNGGVDPARDNDDKNAKGLEFRLAYLFALEYVVQLAILSAMTLLFTRPLIAGLHLSGHTMTNGSRSASTASSNAPSSCGHHSSPRGFRHAGHDGTSAASSALKCAPSSTAAATTTTSAEKPSPRYLNLKAQTRCVQNPRVPSVDKGKFRQTSGERAIGHQAAEALVIDVVTRTALGAALHLFTSILYVIFLVLWSQGLLCQVGRGSVFYLSVLGFVVHLNISHRDDLPLRRLAYELYITVLAARWGCYDAVACCCGQTGCFYGTCGSRPFELSSDRDSSLDDDAHVFCSESAIVSDVRSASSGTLGPQLVVTSRASSLASSVTASSSGSVSFGSRLALSRSSTLSSTRAFGSSTFGSAASGASAPTSTSSVGRSSSSNRAKPSTWSGLRVSMVFVASLALDEDAALVSLGPSSHASAAQAKKRPSTTRDGSGGGAGEDTRGESGGGRAVGGFDGRSGSSEDRPRSASNAVSFPAVYGLSAAASDPHGGGGDGQDQEEAGTVANPFLSGTKGSVRFKVCSEDAAV